MKQLLTTVLLLSSLFVSAQSWQWGKRGGASTDGQMNNIQPEETVVHMVVDTRGNVYALAVIESLGSPNLTGGTFTSYGNRDIALISYRCDGTLRWRKTIGGGDIDFSFYQGLGLDTLGHLYVSAAASQSQAGAVTFEGDTTLPNANHKLCFLAQYDTVGNLNWLRQPMPDTATFLNSNSSYWQILDIAVSGNGDVYCVAHLRPGLIGGSSTAIATAGVYLMRYNAQGTLVAVTPFQMGFVPTFTFFQSFGLARTNSGKFIIAGQYPLYVPNFTGGFSLGGQSVTKSMFVACFNTNGSLAWKKFSTDSLSGAYGRPAIDGQGNIYIAGATALNPQFNGSPLSNTLGPNNFPFAIKMDSMGNNVWAVSSATNAATECTAGVLRGGEFVITGAYPGRLQWPGLPKVLNHGVNTGYDVFMTRLDAQTGQALWQDSLAGIGTVDISNAIATDKTGNIYVGGRFSNNISIAGTIHQSAGGASDFFIAKYGVANCNCSAPTASFSKTQNNSARSVTVIYNGATTGLDSLVWYWGDGQKQKVTSNYTVAQSHTYAASAGPSFNVCATAYSSCGQNQSCQTVGFTVGIEEVNADKGGLLLVPNPAQDATTVQYSFSAGATKRAVQVYDVTGRLMATLDNADSIGKWPIKLKGWATGLYQVVLKADGKVVAHSKLSVMQ